MAIFTSELKKIELLKLPFQSTAKVPNKINIKDIIK
jgi:hypothetical protein